MDYGEVEERRGEMTFEQGNDDLAGVISVVGTFEFEQSIMVVAIL